MKKRSRYRYEIGDPVIHTKSGSRGRICDRQLHRYTGEPEYQIDWGDDQFANDRTYYQAGLELDLEAQGGVEALERGMSPMTVRLRRLRKKVFGK